MDGRPNVQHRTEPPLPAVNHTLAHLAPTLLPVRDRILRQRSTDGRMLRDLRIDHRTLGARNTDGRMLRDRRTDHRTQGARRIGGRMQDHRTVGIRGTARRLGTDSQLTVAIRVPTPCTGGTTPACTGATTPACTEEVTPVGGGPECIMERRTEATVPHSGLGVRLRGQAAATDTAAAVILVGGDQALQHTAALNLVGALVQLPTAAAAMKPAGGARIHLCVEDTIPDGGVPVCTCRTTAVQRPRAEHRTMAGRRITQGTEGHRITRGRTAEHRRITHRHTAECHRIMRDGMAVHRRITGERMAVHRRITGERRARHRRITGERRARRHRIMGARRRICDHPVRRHHIGDRDLTSLRARFEKLKPCSCEPPQTRRSRSHAGATSADDGSTSSPPWLQFQVFLQTLPIAKTSTMRPRCCGGTATRSV
jgi:hypothetical protein